MKYDKLLSVSAEEVGYMEKSKEAYAKDPSVVYKKTEGAGKDNRTKYWEDLRKSWQGYAWCMCFQYWIFLTAYGKDTADKLLYVDEWYPDWEKYNCFDNDTWWANWEHHGRVFKTPKIGDLIYFTNGKRVNHVGLVIGLDDTYVYTREGNTSMSEKTSVISNGGMVCDKKYKRTNSKIKGYARPDWSVIEEENVMIELPVLKKGDKRIEVYRAKQLLKARGWKGFKLSQTFGSGFESAVKRFQEAQEIEQNGTIDKDTWTALFH